MWIKEKIKAWLGPIWWYALVMFVVQRMGDVINIYAGLFLVPHWVPKEQLGALLPLGQIGGLLGLPLAIVLAPFIKFINTFAANGERGKVKALLYDALALAGVSGVVIVAYTWVSAPLVFTRLRIHDSRLLWLLCGLAITSVFMPMLNNALQGLKLFRNYGWMALSSAPMRLILLLLLLPVSALVGFFSAQLLMNVVGLAVGFWGLRFLFKKEVHRCSYRSNLPEMFRYTVPVAGMMAVNTLATTFQYLVIRQRLPDVESAAYYFNSRFAEIPSMLWSSVSVAFFPIVSETFETGKRTGRILIQVLAFSVFGGGAIALFLCVVVKWLFGLIGSWTCYQPYAYLVGWMAMTNVFNVALACFSAHEMACRRFGFLAYLIPLSLLETSLLVVLTGYGFFEPYLPHPWLDAMAALHAARLSFLVKLLFLSALARFTGVLVQLICHYWRGGQIV